MSDEELIREVERGTDHPKYIPLLVGLVKRLQVEVERLRELYRKETADGQKRLGLAVAAEREACALTVESFILESCGIGAAIRNRCGS